MNKIIPFIIAFFFCTLTINAQRDKILYKRTVRLIGVEHDGSETLRIVSYGRNKNDAKEQAMKDAVYIAIFEGIKEAASGPNSRPILDETNAREKYQEYFDVFFTDNGDYRNYVSLIDTKNRSSNKTKTKIGYNYEMTVRVLRSQLKSRLQADNVLRY